MLYKMLTTSYQPQFPFCSLSQTRFMSRCVRAKVRAEVQAESKHQDKHQRKQCPGAGRRIETQGPLCGFSCRGGWRVDKGGTLTAGCLDFGNRRPSLRIEASSFGPLASRYKFSQASSLSGSSVPPFSSLSMSLLASSSRRFSSRASFLALSLRSSLTCRLSIQPGGLPAWCS